GGRAPGFGHRFSPATVRIHARLKCESLSRASTPRLGHDLPLCSSACSRITTRPNLRFAIRLTNPPQRTLRRNENDEVEEKNCGAVCSHAVTADTGRCRFCAEAFHDPRGPSRGDDAAVRRG